MSTPTHPPFVRWLDEPGEAPTADEVGGKGAGLAFLAGCTSDTAATVPRAFAVTTAAFEATVRRDTLDRIAALLPAGELTPGALEDLAARARQIVADLALPPMIDEAIRSAYDLLAEETVGAAPGEATGTATKADAATPAPTSTTDPGSPAVVAPGADLGVPVAVRSSAAGEDSADASFAGEHDSYLWVSGGDEVVRRVRDCWASLWTARAMAYRTGSAQPVTPMAVVVQHMVPATAAGVFMTLNPVNGDRSKVVIEALWGLGEPVVGGTADPDRWIVDKITGDVAGSTIVDKPSQLVRNAAAGQGTIVQDVDEPNRSRPSLSTEQVAQLVAVARVIEREAGGPQDGEFAVHDDVIHLLQARPETVWATKPRQSITGGKSALGSIVDTLSRGSGWTTS